MSGAVLDDLEESIGNLQRDKSVEATRQTAETRTSITETIRQGIAKGLDIVGKKFEEIKYYLAELTISSDIAEGF